MQTYEFVTPKHPDKICDQIADAILDAYLGEDSDSRVAVEVMGGHGRIKITGEITSSAEIDMESVAQRVSETDYDVEVFVSKQSSEIARGVDDGGAGDQGIMTGFATSEAENFMPVGYEVARNLCGSVFEKYPYDGKVQVTLDDDKVTDAVASFQNSKTADLEELVRGLVEAERYHINPSGEWKIGGFEADSGLSGRKIVIDNYGPYVPVGGGSFSGKDPTKVDRSGAYMARKIAVDLLKKHGAQKVLVHLAYVIGEKEPVQAVAKIVSPDGVVYIELSQSEKYDLTPQGIIEKLNLKKPQYLETARRGHFGLNNTNWG